MVSSRTGKAVRWAAFLGLSLGLWGCPDTEGQFDEYGERYKEIYGEGNGSASQTCDPADIPDPGEIDGTFLFTGGWTGTYPTLPSPTDVVRVWDPVSSRFRTVGKLTRPRVNHVARRLGDGRVLIAGGVMTASATTAELWDPKTGLSQSLGQVPGTIWLCPARFA